MSLSHLVNKFFGIFVSAEQQSAKPWLENFVILYVNKCLILDDDITDFARLSRAELSAGELQSVAVYLKAYLHKIGETFEPSDLRRVLDVLPTVCSIHVTGFQSEGAVRAWCQDQKPDGPKEDVDAFVGTLKGIDKTGEDWAELSKSLLKFRFAQVFVRRYSQDFLSYTDTMLEDHIASTGGRF